MQFIEADSPSGGRTETRLHIIAWGISSIKQRVCFLICIKREASPRGIGYKYRPLQSSPCCLQHTADAEDKVQAMREMRDGSVRREFEPAPRMAGG